MYLRWLDEIEDFRFAVTHLPGARNPSDPLSHRGFTDGDGPAASTGDPDAESPEELFSLLATFVRTLAVELVVDALFGPVMCAAAAVGQLVDRLGAPIGSHAPKGGA